MTNNLFSSDLWLPALERYGSDTRLSVKLFDADERVVFGPIHPTPLFQLFEDKGYDPGIFAECARRCLAQTDSRPAVMVSEIYGLAAPTSRCLTWTGRTCSLPPATMARRCRRNTAIPCA